MAFPRGLLSPSALGDFSTMRVTANTPHDYLRVGKQRGSSRLQSLATVWELIIGSSTLSWLKHKASELTLYQMAADDTTSSTFLQGRRQLLVFEGIICLGREVGSFDGAGWVFPADLIALLYLP